MTFSPAAADTILRHLRSVGASPEDYDRIFTGDLGKTGSDILLELCAREGVDISENHCDGGLMIFDRETQDVHSGGSGCGCSASVLCADILPRLKGRELGRVLFVGTGALLSATSVQQGLSIPAIAHAVELSAI